MGDGKKQQGEEGRRAGIGLGPFLPLPLNNTGAQSQDNL